MQPCSDSNPLPAAAFFHCTPKYNLTLHSINPHSNSQEQHWLSDNSAKNLDEHLHSGQW
jgi:hypothetical protein